MSLEHNYLLGKKRRNIMAKYYWQKQQQRSTYGQPRFVVYLLDASGTMAGRVQNTTEGHFMAYAGRPAELIGIRDTLEAAKKDVIRDARERGLI
jgi:hypothetical protein